MSNKPIDMYKIRQLLRLYSSGRGTKFISRITGIARNTVKKYLHQLVTLRLTLAEMEAMSDAALARAFLLEKPKVVKNRPINLELLLPALAARLKKRGVTKKMLYEQYIRQHPDGYKHSIFLVRLNVFTSVVDKNNLLDAIQKPALIFHRFYLPLKHLNPGL